MNRVHWKLIIVFSLLLGITGVAYAQDSIRWIAQTGVIINSNGEVEKTAVDGLSNAGAYSENILKAGDDGHVEFILQNVSDEWLFGLAAPNTEVYWKSIDYGFHIQQDSVWVSEKGESMTSKYSISIGDTLRVERTGSNIYYYHNSSQLRFIATNNTVELIADLCIYTQYAKVSDIKASYPPKLNIEETSLLLDCTEDVASVNLDVYGGQSPYTVEWKDGFSGTSIANLKGGSYEIRVTDDDADTLFTQLDVAYEMNSDVNANVTVTSDNITSTWTADQWNKARSVSNNILPQGHDGWVEFRLQDSNLSDHLLVGLDPNPILISYKASDYKFRLSNGNVCVYENSSKKITGPPILGGMILRIERVGTAIRYYIDGVQLYESKTLSNTGLYIHTNIFHSGAEVHDLKTSFGDHCNVQYRDCTESTRNWQQTSVFNRYGETMSVSRTYVDQLGRPTQSISSNNDNGTLIAAQTVYDAYGRPVLQSLPAVQDENGTCYTPDLLTNQAGQPYSYPDFDMPVTTGNLAGEINNPKPVQQTNDASVGWYYSDNNTIEPYVATTDFPYARVQYYNDPLARLKRTSAPGDHHYMGSGREHFYFTSTSGGELAYVFGYAKSNILTHDGDPYLPRQYDLSGTFHILKSIVRDVNGLEQITYTDASGTTVATAVSGKNNMSSVCMYQSVSKTLDYDGEQKADIHLPLANNGTLKFLYPENFTTISGLSNSDVIFHIYDMENEEMLTEGTDYTIATDGVVTFLGGNASRSLFLRISFSYSQNFWTIAGANPNSIGSNIPSPGLEHQLDYSHWALYYYNNQGQLAQLVQPEGVSCDTFDPTNGLTIEQTRIDKNVLNLGIGNDVASYTVGQPPLGSNLSNQIELFHSTPNPVYGRYASQGGVFTVSDFSDADMQPITVDETAKVKTNNMTSVPDAFGHNVFGLFGDDVARPGYYVEGSKTATTTQVFNREIDLICDGNATDIAEFKVTLVFQENNNNITDPFDLTATLVGCSSDFGWVFDRVHREQINYLQIPQSTQSVELLLQNIEVKLPGETTFQPFDWNNWTHLYAQYLGVRNTATVFTFPVDPPDHDMMEQTIYNELDRPVASTDPDRGKSEVIYDEEGKPRFSQDAGQKLSNRFSYIIYDGHLRPIESGEYDPALVTSGTKHYFPEDHYHGTPSIPPGFTTLMDIVEQQDGLNALGKTQVHYTQYDEVDGTQSLPSDYTAGQVTKAWNEHSTSWFAYNGRGMPVKKWQDVTGVGLKKTNYIFDHFGNLSAALYQAAKNDEFNQIFGYDRNQRLVSAMAGDGLGMMNTSARYTYYAHGALKRTELGENLQGLDYVYTLNGQLKSINHPSLGAADPGTDGNYSFATTGFYGDVFGITLDYYKNDYVRAGTGIESGMDRTTERYDGTIKSVRWNNDVLGTPAGGGHWTYDYQYDWQGRLTEASFGDYDLQSKNSTLGTGYQLTNLTYDLNGNIETLDRYDQNGSLLHSLSYLYNQGNNQLFEIMGNGSANYDREYYYDAAGRMYEEIGPTAAGSFDITYNAIGKVSEVKDDNNLILYRLHYNENGQRLKKTNYDVQQNITKEIWYIRGIGGEVLSIYEKDHGQSNPTVERTEAPLYGLGRIGSFTDYNSTISYVYEITDHLGNVRATVKEDAGNLSVESYADYYPFGMSMAGRELNSSPIYRYSYQGQEVDSETGWSAFELRNYNSVIGRWLSPDPYAQHWSPYLAMSNNPISFIDPDGGEDGNYDSAMGDVPWWARRKGSLSAAYSNWNDYYGDYKFHNDFGLDMFTAGLRYDHKQGGLTNYSSGQLYYKLVPYHSVYALDDNPDYYKVERRSRREIGDMLAYEAFASSNNSANFNWGQQDIMQDEEFFNNLEELARLGKKTQSYSSAFNNLLAAISLFDNNTSPGNQLEAMQALYSSITVFIPNKSVKNLLVQYDIILPLIIKELELVQISIRERDRALNDLWYSETGEDLGVLYPGSYHGGWEFYNYMIKVKQSKERNVMTVAPLPNSAFQLLNEHSSVFEFFTGVTVPGSIKTKTKLGKLLKTYTTYGNQAKIDATLYIWNNFERIEQVIYGGLKVE